MHALRARIPVPLLRVLLRTGLVVMRAYWMIVRPHTRGVKCVVRHGGRVVIVRHTYGDRSWDLPGGAVGRRESLEQAVRRELREELGVAVGSMRLLHTMAARPSGKRDVISFFAVDVDGETLTVDPGEIAEARWIDPAAIPPGSTHYARAVIARSLWEVDEEAL